MVDTINQTFLSNEWTIFLGKLPFYKEGIGWLVPALGGVIVGYIFDKLKHATQETETKKIA